MPDLFQTVYGRGLVPELKTFVHRPYLVVTMADLWDRFADQFDDGLVGPMLVTDLERDELDRQVAALPPCASVIGLGGGQALDVAKYVAWTRRIPLFQVPTALSVNAAWGHRAAVRVDGVVRYVAFAVPEAVYVDFDVIRSAPLDLNRSGVGDILCYWTGHWDWKMAAESGQVEARWPYDPALVAEARVALDRVLDHADEIRDDVRSGHSGSRGVAALGRRGLPQRRLEPAPHRGRRAFRLLQPRIPHGEALPPRAARDARRPPHERPPGEQAGGDPCRSPTGSVCGTGPKTWA